MLILQQKKNEWHQRCSLPPHQIATTSCERIFIRLSLTPLFKDLPQAMKTCCQGNLSPARWWLVWFVLFFVVLLRFCHGNKERTWINVRKWQLWIWDGWFDADWCLCVSQKRLNHQFTSSVICLCDSHSVFTSTVWATAALHVLWLDLNSRLRNVIK